MRFRRFGGITDSLHGMPMMTPGGVLSDGPLGGAQWDAVYSSLAGVSHGSLTISFPVGITPENVPAGFELERATTHVLSLDPGWEAIWKGFDRHHRTSVRRARKLGVVVRRETGGAAVRDHWDLITPQFGKWKPNPTPSFEFIRDACQVPEAWLYVARQGERAVVSLLAFAYKKEVFLWQTARTERDYPHGASNLLKADLIREACEAGYEVVNFGGSLGNPGIEKYKEAFGASKVSYSILKRSHPLVRKLKGFLR